MNGESSNGASSQQSTRWGPFTREEFAVFRLELKSKFWGGVRSSTGFIYISFTLVGIGWASWFIPTYNESEMSPETFGIYVIGFLITVMLDAIMIWKKSGVGNENEQAISGIFMVMSFLMIIGTSWLSVKSFHLDTNKARVGEWKCYASPILSIVLVFTIAMSLVLTGIDSNFLEIGSVDRSVEDVRDR